MLLREVYHTFTLETFGKKLWSPWAMELNILSKNPCNELLNNFLQYLRRSTNKESAIHKFLLITYLLPKSVSMVL